jgi:hypothetical protein
MKAVRHTLARRGEKNRFTPTGNVDKHPEMMKWFEEGLRDFRGILEEFVGESKCEFNED